jgi:putative tricarboxylic transport membrane protein
LKPRAGDLASGAVLVALGVFIVLQARRWEYLGPDGPGPGFFPLWYGIAMIALALLLIASSAGWRGREAARQGEALAARVGFRLIGRPLAAWAALAVCVALLKVLGFLVAFGLFAFFVTAVMYRRPILPSVAVAVGCALGFYILFPLALNVMLPTGLLGF